MKNRAIEAMIRAQYNLKDSDKVEVKFEALIDGEFEFMVTDYSNHEDGEVSVRDTIVMIKHLIR